MKILPTLNLQNGFAIPMLGNQQRARKPGEVLDALAEHGCHRLTLVDVDAAAGRGHNRDLIASIMRRFQMGSTKVCIQVGGGIRSSDQAQFFVDHGATWILVGTIIQRSPLVVDQLLARFRDCLTAGVDARCGEIQSSGWREPAPLKAIAAAQRIREHGFKRILFTDIPPLPALPAGSAGPAPAPDFATARALAQCARVPLFMGGSIHTLEHLAQAREIPGLQGVAMDALVLLEDMELLGSLNLTRI